MKFDNLSFSIDENSYCWSLTGQVSDREQWVLAEVGKEIEVQIGADTYRFIIDTRERVEIFGESSFNVTARSKSSKYGEGSIPLHKTWGNTTTDTVINELIDTPSINIPNWNLANGVLISEGETPIALVTRIANAVGGIVYSDSEGDLYIVPKYKIAPANYDITNVDHVLSDFDDVFELKETKEFKPGYNEVWVSNEPDSNEGSIVISEHEINKVNLTAILKVVVFPFVLSIELLTSRNNVTILPSEIQTETLTEVIEIVDGVGNVSQPVLSIDSHTYLDLDLGTLVFNNTNISSFNKKTSLLEITYVTQFHFVTIQSDIAKDIQVYVEEGL